MQICYIKKYILCLYTDHESYLGCFYDTYDPERGTSKGAVRVLPNAQFISRAMTIGQCINFCVGEGELLMRYAGLITGDECWCGLEDARYNRYGQRSNDECSTPCAGNPAQTCGNDFRIAVYDRRFMSIFFSLEIY